MKKLVFPAVAIAFLLSSAAQAQAGCPMCKMLSKLELSADQQKQVEKLKEGMMAKMLPIKAQIGVKVAEMKVLWLKDTPDKKAILAKYGEIETLRQVIREGRVDFKLAIHKMLTPSSGSRCSCTWTGAMARAAAGAGTAAARGTARAASARCT
jgi:Spy/CpxP family protein refolding chaperone